MSLALLLYQSDHPFAQGLFTALLISILVFIFSFIKKGITKATDSLVVNSGNINSILKIALKKYNEGDISSSINSYTKVLEIEEYNITALISLGNIYLSNKENYTAERYLQILYNEYNNKINSSTPIIANNKNKLCIAAYKLGYLLSQRGESSKALAIKTFSLSNSNIEREHSSLLTKYNY
jgi:hypothetical protein